MFIHFIGTLREMVSRVKPSNCPVCNLQHLVASDAPMDEIIDKRRNNQDGNYKSTLSETAKYSDNEATHSEGEDEGVNFENTDEQGAIDMLMCEDFLQINWKLDEYCLWKYYHKCLEELKNDEYHHLDFTDDDEDLDDSYLDRTREQQERNKRRKTTNIF